MLFLIFGCHHTKKILAGFLVSRGSEDCIKAKQKAVLELKALNDVSGQVLKILIDPSRLSHATTSSLSEPF